MLTTTPALRVLPALTDPARPTGCPSYVGPSPEQADTAKLPIPRGPLSAYALRLLTGRASAPAAMSTVPDPLADDDLQLALWCCYEVAYRGFAGVPDELEWNPELIRFRTRLEAEFLAGLRAAVTRPDVVAAEVPTVLSALVAADDGPPLSTFLQRQATRAQFEEFVQHRSVYHLKEADPHSWAIPRLGGRAKVALVEIQSDEYGGGDHTRMHATLFRDLMRGLGLDTAYAAYLDRVPGWTLAITNLMSMFGLHRRWRGALVGHLAAFEMTSSVPNSRYARGIRRLGLDDATARFYDEHIEADAVHEQIALHELCGSLATAEPALAGDMLFGAGCALDLDSRFGRRLLGSWADGRSSLR